MSNCPYRVFYWNCAAGLVGKWDIIRAWIEAERPDVFFISEADIAVGVDTSLFGISGYTFATSSTLNIVNKARMVCWYRNFFNRSTNLEFTGNEIMVLHHKKSCIVGLYRPFKCYFNETHKSNFDRLMSNLYAIGSNTGHSNLLVVGDFNVHINSANRDAFAIALEEWADKFILSQQVTFSTRFRMVGNVLQSSMLDLVFTTFVNLKITAEHNTVSDHSLLKLVGSSYHNKFEKKRVSYYDWRSYSAAAMCSLVNNCLPNPKRQVVDPDLINDSVATAIASALTILVPKRYTTLRGSNAVISGKIQNLKNRKSRAYKKFKESGSHDDFIYLKLVSRELNYEIRRERKRKSNLNTGDPKRFWNSVNSLMGKKVSQHLSILSNDDSRIQDPEKLADMFISFFVGKIEALELLCPVPSKEVLFSNVSHDIVFTKEEVSKAIREIKHSKAQGLDEIPSCVLRDLSDVISLHLTWLFNTIMYTGLIPKSWKISKIVPIFKKGCPHTISNYRPISNTSSLSKIFERAILNKMETLFSNELLNGSHQHGFLPGSSTVTACLTVQDYVSSELDKGNIVLMYSADLSAAFDMVRQDILVDICRAKGFPESLCRVFYNFLSNRLGYVEIDGSSSYLKEIPVGCVQGSVLGPRIFNIYTSNLDTVVGPEAFKLAYADDSYIAMSCHPDDFDPTKTKLERTVAVHFDWLKSLGMVVNPSKTEFIIFHPSQYKCIWNDPLMIDNCKVFPSKTLKILGVHFSHNLDWSTHVNAAIKKANSMLYALRYLNSKLSRDRFKTLIFAHFISKITYASQVWSGSIPLKLRKRLDSCYFKVLRLLCRDFKGSKSRPVILNQTGMVSLRAIFFRRDASLLYYLCTTLKPDSIVVRLISQCYFISRQSNRLLFFDSSSKRIGRHSFINRARYISELIPFEWSHLNPPAFKSKIRMISQFI
jgi:hypothetical protein